MLGLWRPNTGWAEHSLKSDNFVGWLQDATDVCETQTLNENWTLSFSYPRNGRFSESLREAFAVVECEGHMFITESVVSESDALDKVTCRHSFFRDASKMHVPNLGSTDTSDTIGINPMALAKKAFVAAGNNDSDQYHHYYPLGCSEARKLGLSLLGGDEDNETDDDLKIDWESTDKTTPLEVLKQIIENCGRGEIYVGKNRKWALVERVGEDKSIVLNTANFAKSVSVTRDYSDVITRLYVYGKDDLTIVNATRNTDGTAYVKSENYDKYPVCDGYADYSDIEDAEKLFERALWAIDEENPDRVDVPKITITATVAELSAAGGRSLEISIGDRLCVFDLGVKYSVRCLERTRYPFEPAKDSLTLGTPEKDAFFYLNQLGKLAARYKSSSTYKGYVQGGKISGTTLKLGKCTLKGAADGLYVNNVLIG